MCTRTRGCWLSHVESDELLAITVVDETLDDILIEQPEMSNNFSCLFNCCKKTNSEIQDSGYIKVEPKTFFANERTYLQWFNSGILVATLGTWHLDNEADYSIGVCLLFISFLIVAYALWFYHKRNRLLLAKSPYGYHDMIGPTILTIVIVLAFIIGFSI